MSVPMYDSKRQQQYLMEQQYINEYYNNYQSSQYQIHPVYNNAQNQRLTYAKQQQKLQKLNNHILKLREQLNHPTILVSVAAASLIKYTTSNFDPLIPKSFDSYEKFENPFTVKKNASCNCIIL
ncbi:hypothetical protein BCR32DRAFT_17770 [Anaeromyces robustus]|uniref:G protein gamma domain-containing protein n=1 Tax=Anaeromyces robustus TaxID=1754192 RepID=A0A1Y1X692_9FUNG|nr:hypothetical protein BCR32DRAFT_17770 [Anaeromyces robustus]|eukprot:ORX80824.1 hypothetical protein BCR32DRAFT_17770 [Anaeromyces robustus]